MKGPIAHGTDAETLLGRVTLEVLDMLRGGQSRTGEDDALTQVLAERALLPPVTGCVVAVVDHEQSFRVAGAAGTTGRIRVGSRWPLSGSTVATSLAHRQGNLTEAPLDNAGIGAALRATGVTSVFTLPMRIGDRGDAEPTSLGAMLLVTEPNRSIGEPEARFLDGLSSLASLLVLGATPAHQWARRASRLRNSVDVAVDTVGSLDAVAVPRLLARACEAVAADRAALLMLDGQRVVVEGVHDVAGPAGAQGIVMSLEQHPFVLDALRAGDVVVGGRVQVRGAPAYVREAYADMCHSLMLPLELGDEVAGFITVSRRSARPFVADDGTILEFLGQVAILALRNSRLYGEAQAASSAMSAFLRLIVHDLRAPLTVLSGYVDLLRDGTFGPAPATWEKPMSTIAAKIQESQRLVDDILLAARLESGAIVCNPQRLDLNEVVARAAERAEPRVLLAGGSIETAPADRPTLAHADGFHVDRIIDNLVNNAINYGGRTPWVRLSVDAADAPVVRVEDSGVGISEDLHARVFEPFFRVDNRVPGTGFGLHVGRVLASACGGNLLLERSAPNAGSVFRLELLSPPEDLDQPDAISS